MSAVEQSQFRENVTLLRVDSREIYLVGTAHVSRSSAELVSSIIQEVSPDRIGIELCAARYDSLQDPDRWRKTDIFEVIKSGRAYVLLTQLVLAAFQRRLADQFGIRPGEEMLTAMTLAAEKSIPLSLIDRDVKITLRRAWSHAGLLGVAKIMASFITSFFSKDQVTERELEELKKGDALAALMSEFSDALAGGKERLLMSAIFIWRQRSTARQELGLLS